MAGRSVGKLVRRYAAVVIFPTLAATSIYADWSHTRDWKKEQKEKAKAEELLKQL